MADEGFDRASLPATFMEFLVLVNDGTHGYPAEGKVILGDARPFAPSPGEKRGMCSWVCQWVSCWRV